MSTLADLKAELLAKYEGAPQQRWHVSAAIEMVQQGLAELRSMGHLFDIVDGETAPPVEWPKMFYHQTIGSLAVNSQAEADELGPGWSDHPSGVNGGPVPEPVVETEPSPQPVTVDIASYVAQASSNDSPSNDSHDSPSN